MSKKPQGLPQAMEDAAAPRGAVYDPPSVVKSRGSVRSRSSVRGRSSRSRPYWLEFIITLPLLLIAMFAIVFIARAVMSNNLPVPTATVAEFQATQKVLQDGLTYLDTQIGNGDTAVAGKSLTVNYTGKLSDGSIFDTSLGKTPFTFTLGNGTVIKGWDEGIVGMKVGGKRTLTIPAALGYGAADQGAIPPNATLIFDVELLSVK